MAEVPHDIGSLQLRGRAYPVGKRAYESDLGGPSGADGQIKCQGRSADMVSRHSWPCCRDNLTASADSEGIAFLMRLLRRDTEPGTRKSGLSDGPRSG